MRKCWTKSPGLHEERLWEPYEVCCSCTCMVDRNVTFWPKAGEISLVPRLLPGYEARRNGLGVGKTRVGEQLQNPTSYPARESNLKLSLVAAKTLRNGQLNWVENNLGTWRIIIYQYICRIKGAVNGTSRHSCHRICPTICRYTPFTRCVSR